MVGDDLLWQIGKLGRLRFWYQARKRRGVLELFVGLNNALAMGILGFMAYLTSWPLIFPSLGPSLFLIFYAPQRAMSAPRNTLLAHLLGGAIGLGLFTLLETLGLVSGTSFDQGRILSAALSLGLFGFLMIRLRILHPPAASTALIAATGLLPHWSYLPLLGLALIIIILQAHLLHRLAGIPYPSWSPLKEEEPEIFTPVGRLKFGSSTPQDLSELADQLIASGRPNQQKR